MATKELQRKRASSAREPRFPTTPCFPKTFWDFTEHKKLVAFSLFNKLPGTYQSPQDKGSSSRLPCILHLKVLKESTLHPTFPLPGFSDINLVSPGKGLCRYKVPSQLTLKIRCGDWKESSVGKAFALQARRPPEHECSSMSL